jgi:hypothetical protein
MLSLYNSENKQLSASINKLLYSTIKQLKGFNDMYYSAQIEPMIKSMLRKTDKFNFATVLPLFEALGYLSYYLFLMKSPNCKDL